MANDYPQWPVTIIVPYSVGGTTDIVARLAANQVGNSLGQPMIVENRTGGGGQVGWSAAARAKADGYTLLTTEMSFTIAPGLVAKQPFNAREDFTHIITAASAPHVLVIPTSFPAQNLQEFIAAAKAQPATLNYGSGGNGTNTHLGAELFKKAAQVELLHVPYKGSGQVLTDLMAGQVQMLVTSLPTALPHIKSGKLRPLVVASKERHAELPEVPAAPEAGLPDFVMDFWVGFAAPAGTPEAVINQLNQAFSQALNSEQGKQRLAEQGLTSVANTPAQASAQADAEMKRWAAIIQSANIKPQ